MPVKIKTNLRDLTRAIPDARSNASREIKREIVRTVRKNIKKGISPVAGTNKFKSYADSTAKIKGRRDPVTLEDSLEMMESLEAVLRVTKVIQLFFKGARNNKIAAFHHNGTDNLPQRPVIPATKGQKFKKKIINKFIKIINKAHAKSTK